MKESKSSEACKTPRWQQRIQCGGRLLKQTDIILNREQLIIVTEKSENAEASLITLRNKLPADLSHATIPAMPLWLPRCTGTRTASHPILNSSLGCHVWFCPHYTAATLPPRPSEPAAALLTTLRPVTHCCITEKIWFMTWTWSEWQHHQKDKTKFPVLPLNRFASSAWALNIFLVWSPQLKSTDQ